MNHRPTLLPMQSAIGGSSRGSSSRSGVCVFRCVGAIARDVGAVVVVDFFGVTGHRVIS